LKSKKGEKTMLNSFSATLQNLDKCFEDMCLIIEAFRKQNTINLDVNLLSKFEKTLNFFKQKINEIKRNDLDKLDLYMSKETDEDDLCYVKVSSEKLIIWTDKYDMLARFVVDFDKKESEITALDITADGFFVLSIEVGERFFPKFSIGFCSQTYLENLLKDLQDA
jgi:hypothetical protein